MGSVTLALVTLALQSCAGNKVLVPIQKRLLTKKKSLRCYKVYDLKHSKAEFEDYCAIWVGESVLNG